MSVVYKARDLRFDKVSRTCAVKEMYNTAPDRRMRELVVQSFDREANTLASLSHPAIPSIFDYFHEGNRIYLVMELVDGQDLEKIIDESPGPIAPSEVISWAIQICDVLAYLHNHQPPFIFRDIKPSNIMVTDPGRITLIDFGIAKVFERGQRGTMVGTAGYPPPEQYRGLAEPRGDVYALGATLHHLLTKRDPRLELPFSFHEHPIREINPKVSEALDAIVMKALSYDIEDRFVSAIDMKHALEAIRAPGQGMSTMAFTSPDLALHLSGTVRPLWEFAAEDEIRSSPTVSGGAVYVGSYDHNLYAVAAEDGEFIWKYATEDVVSSSPQPWEDLILVGSEDNFVYALGRESGGIAWSMRTQGRVRSSPRVSMDRLFVGSDDRGFYCLLARNGRETWRYEAMNYVRSSAAFALDQVYFGASDGNVYALDVHTGKLKWRYATKRTVLSAPLVLRNIVYVGSMDWQLYAIDAKAGWPIWSFRTRGWVVSTPAASPSLGYVYIGSVDGNVYAIDLENGHQAWSYETGGAVTSSPALTEEAVYIGSNDGHLYSLDARDGSLRWKFQTGASVVSSPAIWQDRVIFGSRDRTLYALPL
jgi:outer membrane protein assembly factor BamB